ncbi:MAG: class I SAM-dependent methyltransferase [Alphaproteobacteria bacterium]
MSEIIAPKIAPKAGFDFASLPESAALVLDGVFLLFFFFVALWAGYEYTFNKTGVPTIASAPRMRRKMIACLQRDAAVKAAPSPYTIIDLGSGNGQLTRAIARAMPQAQVIGIEISFLPWLRATLIQKLFGPANLTYERRDFWDYDCGKADAVVMYLVGKKMERVGTKLRRELPPNAMILSNRYALRGDWQAQEEIPLLTPFRNKLYLYRA